MHQVKHFDNLLTKESDKIIKNSYDIWRYGILSGVHITEDTAFNLIYN